jgi:hypothetical protein
MQKKLNWQLFSNENRYEVIENIKNVISNSDGYIVNFNMFSDLALSLSVEIEEKKIQKLHRALSQIINVSELKLNTINLQSKKDWLIFMNISFGKGKGELKQKTPEVPG